MKEIALKWGLFSIAQVIGLAVAFPTMWTWNYAMPHVFNLPVITWGQAWCLQFLAGMLIKSMALHNVDTFKGSK